MKLRSLFLFLIICAPLVHAQKTLDGLLAGLNNENIPYVEVAELAEWLNNGQVLLLDSREREEYAVSRIPGAIYVGYKDFKAEHILPKLAEWDGKIVVYCSLGVRSENIAEKLEKKGIDRVYNLYGGIFEWVNQGQQVVDKNNVTTDRVHAYNRFWGIWLNNANKVYE